MSWSKLFSDIVCSSIWNEDDPTRIVWITMLAIKGPNHIARATVGGLAHQARVSVSDCRKAIEKLTSPDPDGLDQPFEGRRIQAVEHGWLVLNGESYKNRRDDAYRKEYQADWVKAKRLREKLSTPSVDTVDASTTIDNHRHEQSRAEQIRADKEKSSLNGSSEPLQAAHQKSVRSPLMTRKALEELKEVPAYDGIDLEKEAWKFKTWCENNSKNQSKRRFINWLNRIS